MKKMISVIILDNTDRTYLVRCLNSLKRQIYNNVEIILVVNDSIAENTEDGMNNTFTSFSLEEITENIPLTVIHSPGSNRYSRINDALRAVNGDYIFFCSPLSVPAPNTFAELLSTVEDNPFIFTCGCCYIPDVKGYKPYQNMGTSLFGKLFSKELIVKNNIYLHENLVLAEYLFVAEYLHLFTDVNLNSNIYIYEMNAEYLEPGSYSDISREEWAQIFHTLISGETASPAEHYMASSLKKYIERNQIDSVELLYLAEEKIHGLYEVNYTLAQRTLPILWADFIQSGEQEKLELFRNYLQKYDCFLLGTL